MVHEKREFDLHFHLKKKKFILIQGRRRKSYSFNATFTKITSINKFGTEKKDTKAWYFMQKSFFIKEMTYCLVVICVNNDIFN